MSFARDMNEAIAADARLFVLRELARQIDGRLNELSIARVLDLSGIKRSREWVSTQLRKLEELGAAELIDADGLLIAAITRTGRDHLDQRSIIAGVTRPAEAE